MKHYQKYLIKHYWMVEIQLVYGTMVVLFKYSNTLSGPIKKRKFLDQLIDSQLFNENSAPYTQHICK